jgi:FkbM family methyltransferase
MVLPVSNPGSVPLLLFGYLTHEIRESMFVQRLAQSCQIMIDVGAHVGWYARLMWAGMRGKGRVYAFEPDYRTFPYLQENTHNRSGLFSYNMVVGESDKTMTLYCAESSNLSSAVRQVGTPVAVESTTLDSFCRSLGLVDRVDFVKIDVEGGEIAVLRGARQIRSTANPPILMIEIEERFLLEAGTSVDEIMQEIVSQGSPSRIFYLGVDGVAIEIEHVSKRLDVSNVFVVPESRIYELKLAGGS